MIASVIALALVLFFGQSFEDWSTLLFNTNSHSRVGFKENLQIVFYTVRVCHYLLQFVTASGKANPNEVKAGTIKWLTQKT